MLPHYYFHLYNGETLRDDTGEDFANVEAAGKGAARAISELIAEHIAAGRTVDLRHRIEVEDSNGAVVVVVPFSQFFVGSA